MSRIHYHPIQINIFTYFLSTYFFVIHYIFVIIELHVSIFSVLSYTYICTRIEILSYDYISYLMNTQDNAKSHVLFLLPRRTFLASPRCEINNLFCFYLSLSGLPLLQFSPRKSRVSKLLLKWSYFVEYVSIWSHLFSFAYH